MEHLILPFPPFWEAQFHKITHTLFRQTGNSQFIKLPLWIVDNDSDSQKSQPPEKAFFQLTKIDYVDKQIVLSFEVNIPEKGKNRQFTDKLFFPPIEENLFNEVSTLLQQLSQRRIKTKPCWAHFKDSSVTIYR